MSFSLTTQQMRDHTKTVTRRNGWGHLKPGDLVQACVKCRGLKKGEGIEKIGDIRIVSTSWVPLRQIDAVDVVREGFPEMSPEAFIAMFMKSHRGIGRADAVNRIEFEHVGDGG